MRLVDNEQPDAGVLQTGDEARVRDALRRHVEQGGAALGEVDKAAVLLARREGRVDVVGGDARTLQRLHLVLHERDQRRDDERAADFERGQHVAQALAATRGHNPEHVAIREAIEYLGLAGPEVRVSEALLQQLAVPPNAARQLGVWGGRRCVSAVGG